MNHEDTPTREPRVVEQHSLLVQFTIDERGLIAWSVTPDRQVEAVLGINYRELARCGAPFTRVAVALLAAELDRHLLVEVLERTEMRFRRAGRWGQATRAAAERPALTDALAGAEDGIH